MARHWDGVTCPRCLQRLGECPANEHDFPLAHRAFAVGNIARPDMGHQMYHTEDGRTALCAADRLPNPNREEE